MQIQVLFRQWYAHMQCTLHPPRARARREPAYASGRAVQVQSVQRSGADFQRGMSLDGINEVTVLRIPQTQNSWYSRPKVAATARLVTCPLCTLTADNNPLSCAQAASSPWFASLSAYGSVTLHKA